MASNFVGLIAMLVLLDVARPVASDCTVNGTSCNNFGCVYNVLLKLVQLEEEVSKQNIKITGQELMIETLSAELEDNRNALQHQKSDGSTYIRWGRKSCPSDATLVYEGYTAGSHYTHGGGAARPLCLTNKPDWGKYTSTAESAGGFIYGAEYQTSSYSGSVSAWSDLNDYDVPCAVCRVPINDVLMVPGSMGCPDQYQLEYSGYLMAGHYTHAAPSDFVCVDSNPEGIERSHGNYEGYLLYFVEAKCGSLPCEPYFNNREMTCAVCSFARTNSQSLQPHI